MFRIRQKQLEAIRVASLRAFEEKLLAHVRQYFPFDCSSLGADGVREAIRFCIERAEQHGFTTQREITKYVNLVFTFGRGFDELPWVREVRHGAVPPTIDTLYDAALARAGEARGIAAR